MLKVLYLKQSILKTLPLQDVILLRFQNLTFHWKLGWNVPHVFHALWFNKSVLEFALPF